MNWTRIYPMIARWPGGGPPPTFTIAADENGTAVVELAWDPQALASPGSYTAPLRYYSTDVAFNATTTNDDGTSRAISIPAQTIQLQDNRAVWVIPQALWDGYIQETLKGLRTPSGTTFSGNLYYRVRTTAPGAAQAIIWPPTPVLTGANSSAAPHIGILNFSATPSSQVAPDQQAVQAMGGIPFLPNFFGDLLTMLWRALPESNADRMALAAIFAHPTFQAAPLATRANLLKLWLTADAQGARGRLPQLLDRRTVVGSGVTQPIITKTDLHGGKDLVANLLDVLAVTPHPALTGVRTLGQLLEDVVREILDPNGQVNQGAAGTCSPTSLQTMLITINPSEYARLVKGLLSSTGTAVLANGAVITVPIGVLSSAVATGMAGPAFLLRTFSELAFQTALLQFAQANFPTFTGTPQSIQQVLQATIAGGLASNETQQALSGIFNVNFTTRYITFPSQQTNATWLAAQTAIRNSFVADLASRRQPLMLAVYWAAPYANGHAVMAVRNEAGSSRVFFKNPQYPGSNPTPGIAQGGGGTNPPRQYEDPTQTLESITHADLGTWIKGYWLPDTAII